MTVGLAVRFKQCSRTALVMISLLSALAACGGGDDSPPAEADGSSDSCTGEGDTYRVGLSKTSQNGAFTVEITDANPAPPGQGTNAWKLRIKDASGGDVVGAMVNINLYMPKHIHPQPGTSGTDQGGGVYEVSNLNLVMPGLFEITVEVIAGGMTDSAKFLFCISRKGD